MIDLITTHALKEWAITIKALEIGQTMLLLRKGGIRDKNSRFQVNYPKFWLYPTYEHQKPELLKPEFASQVTAVPSGWHPDRVTISSAAEITHSFTVKDAEVIEALFPYHIWNKNLISHRLQWKPQQPLSVLILRTYRLSQAKIIDYHPEYSGCKSWLNLTETINSQELEPVFNQSDYNQFVEEITKQLTIDN